MGVRFDFTDGRRKPVQTDINREHTYHMPLRIVDGLTVAGEDLLDGDTFLCVFKVGFYPVGFVQQ